MRQGWEQIGEDYVFSMEVFGEKMEVATLSRYSDLDWMVNSELVPSWEDEFVDYADVPVEDAQVSVESKVREHLEDMVGYYKELLKGFEETVKENDDVEVER